MYPLKTEAPVVSRTLASEAAASASSRSSFSPSRSSSSSASVTSETDDSERDRFDDGMTLGDEETERIRTEYKARIPTSLSHTFRVGVDPPPHVPPNVPHSSLSIPETVMTTLDNGVRVASQETYGQVCTIGALSNCGSRYETPGSTSGTTHMMELLSFKSTERFPDPLSITNRVDDMGGATFASGSREQMMYCVDVLRINADAALEILGETVRRPQITEEEMEEARMVISFQNEDMIPEVRLGEGLQMAAYGPSKKENAGDDDEGSSLHQQLGMSHLCNEEDAKRTTPESFREFRDSHLLIPSDTVIAGAGIGHDELVELAEAHFGDMKAATGEDSTDGSVSMISSRYTGGEYRLTAPTVEGHIRVAVAFEVGGWHSDDLVPACVLQTLLGGGSSFPDLRPRRTNLLPIGSGGRTRGPDRPSAIPPPRTLPLP